MPAPIDAMDLPRSSAPTLQLLQATESEMIETSTLGSVSWKGPVDTKDYLRREAHLRDQALTRHGGITYWVLVDPTAAPTSAGSRRILASCETIRKRALIARPGKEVKEVISHGIGSVHCNPAYRGRGFAQRMMTELTRNLHTWQQKEGESVDFTVLWSDIGKDFYARLGWDPYPSTHLALSPRSNDDGDASLPRALLLSAEDIVDLCRLDEANLRRNLAESTCPASTIRVALIPDTATMQWHHAREEFLAQLLLGTFPASKGAVAQTPDGRKAWCMWTRTFGTSRDEKVLHILRLVNEDECNADLQASSGINDKNLDAPDQAVVEAIAATLQAAQLEATAWGLSSVQLWNPSPTSELAVRHIDPSAKRINREHESLASLRWHGSALSADTKIDWISNEKYGWC